MSLYHSTSRVYTVTLLPIIASKTAAKLSRLALILFPGGNNRQLSELRGRHVQEVLLDRVAPLGSPFCHGPLEREAYAWQCTRVSVRLEHLMS